MPVESPVGNKFSTRKILLSKKNTELQYFNEAKSYVQNQALLIVSELCNTFAYHFGGLQAAEDTNKNHIATKSVLLLHVNKLLHCTSRST